MLRIARAGLHFFEEPCLSGEAGSGTIFFCGCRMRCRFCQNFKISREGVGVNVSEDEFVLLAKDLERKGALNINLVSPSDWTNQLIPVLKRLKCELKVPIVWNSSGFEEVSDLKKLEGLVDVYLPDFKYSDDALAKEYSSCEGYFEKAFEAVREMKRQQPADVFDERGIMMGGVIVRHLVLPSSYQNTVGVLKAISEISKDTIVSLMGQYFPTPAVKDHPILSRRVSEEEYDRAVDAFFECGLHNGYSQSVESAIEDYVPDFDAASLRHMLEELKARG